MIFTGDESKEHLLGKGIELINEFSALNGIKPPLVIVNTRLRDDVYALFSHENKIQINIKACRPPVKTPGYDWTFPGYVQDLTPFGILAHEFGHYISDNLGKPFRKNFVNIGKRESDITHQDTRGLDEKMAESARLFLTNPDLLKKGRPLRYEIFSRYYEPIVTKKWRTVLKFAHPRIISAAENWIEK